MFRNHTLLFTFPFILCLFLLGRCTTQDPIIIVPETGYQWPENERDYWPTDGWQLADMKDHNIDPSKMNIANEFSANDPLARALVVVKDGYIVNEQYYGHGGVDQSSNLWSVTKSYSSAVVGILKDQGEFNSTNQLMADLLPAYPEFNEITLHHALTHTTGLAWNEEGPKWVEWIFSEDWVAAALARGENFPPGTLFKYSSGNSHFLTSLAYYRTGITPGVLAKEHLFDPMGIPFEVLEETIIYNNWDEYREPLNQTWRQDTKGIECAGFGLYLTARDMAKFGYLYLNKGRWDDRQLLSEDWVINSTRDHATNIYGRYSYGYQWYITLVAGEPVFLASGFGGQIIGVVPSLDMVVVLKYEAEDPEHPVSGSPHDDMHLFELVVRSAL